MNLSRKTLLPAGALILLVLSACTPEGSTAVAPSNPTETLVVVRSETPSSTPAASDTPAPTSTPSETPTPAATPTFASLRGQVMELSNCRYGPGAPYLYFTGLVPGSNLEVIGRREDSQWVYVQAIGGHHPCWVKASQMNIQGDLISLQIVYPDGAPLPKSPYYPATAVTKVVRNGNQVTVTWLDIPLRAGDEEDQYMQHYIIEAWHCQGGQFIFEPLATNETSISFSDDPGCSQPSHGRIFVQEKHGFAGPAEIPWPSFETPTPTPT